MITWIMKNISCFLLLIFFVKHQRICLLKHHIIISKDLKSCMHHHCNVLFMKIFNLDMLISKLMLTMLFLVVWLTLFHLAMFHQNFMKFFIFLFLCQHSLSLRLLHSLPKLSHWPRFSWKLNWSCWVSFSCSLQWWWLPFLIF